MKWFINLSFVNYSFSTNKRYLSFSYVTYLDKLFKKLKSHIFCIVKAVSCKHKMYILLYTSLTFTYEIAQLITVNGGSLEIMSVVVLVQVSSTISTKSIDI